MKDEHLWYQINHFGGWVMLIAGLIYLYVAWIFPCIIDGVTNLSRFAVHTVVFGEAVAATMILIRSYEKGL
jgi:hypothetical protein